MTEEGVTVHAAQTTLLRTFIVTVAAGQEQEALKRAQTDPHVELAYVDFRPGD